MLHVFQACCVRALTVHGAGEADAAQAAGVRPQALTSLLPISFSQELSAMWTSPSSPITNMARATVQPVTVLQFKRRRPPQGLSPSHQLRI